MNEIERKIIHLYSKLRNSSKCIIEKNSVALGNCIFEGGNKISPESYINSVRLGFGSYIGSNSHFSNAEIGRFTSIGDNVKLISATHPIEEFVSTSPCFYSRNNCLHWIKEDKFNEYAVNENSKAITIGNDVWIGSNVLLKGGISIGDGAVVAMGAVVTKDIPPYAVAGGVPAKVIKYRFNENQRERLLANPWWNKSLDWIKNNVNRFENVETLLEVL